ncbi:transcriptional regulator [Methanobrevibacter arboriphilus JCM 13429 = DSM 1125]|uniref:Transcriptional regulator n=1 Tax=Methanobrevibacter arboriphilus JCM 13429 = DSM 1125 TaxID=1300164 RepID=A0A1V6N276_METAZ|nr:metal-dependent transcriptional regulator [Methanobrevibacter arboriphilus]OQD58820.1 transcriptional regulator [Methanobrevibacter arboriphilus JCM 13429 = DSM 1125]
MSNKELSENIEEYLEVLYKYGDKETYVSTTKISKMLEIAPGSVTQMLKKLEDLGYINYIPYKGANLSDKGFKVAQKITRKHRILEKFLTDVLNVKPENVHIQACDMEHSLSDEAERAMCHILEHPDFCPDEKPIPPCDFDFSSCQDCVNEEKDIEEIGVRKSNLISIVDLYTNEKAEVSFIRGNSDVLKNLMSLGIAIGTQVKLNEIDENKSSLNISVNGTDIELPGNIANNIFVSIL